MVAALIARLFQIRSGHTTTAFVALRPARTLAVIDAPVAISPPALEPFPVPSAA